MAEISGIPLGAVALYSLAVDSMMFLANCVHFPDDANRLHVKFLLQKDILIAWGKASRMDRGFLSPHLHEHAIRKVFVDIHSISASTESLIEKYHLKLANLPTPHPYPINHLENLTPSRNSVVLSQYEQRIRQLRANTPWVLRFRWASWDKVKFEVLINDLKDLTDALDKLLRGPQYETFLSEKTLTRVRRVTSGDLVQLHTLEAASVDNPTLRTSTRLKITQVEEFQRRLFPQQPNSPISTRLRREDIEGVANSQHSSIRISTARYKGQNVLIEWKPYGNSSQRQSVDRGDTLMRVHALAILLMQDKPEDLRALRCLGFVDDVVSSQFCFVFEWPRVVPTSVQPQNLLDLIRIFPSASLSDRLRFAYQVAGCIFELLVVGWYHKCIRPQNILFFPERSRNEVPNLYLIGFDYSRPAGNAAQISEGELENPEFNIYRPYQQLIPKQPFRVDFDIYSFGLVLLVIAKWKKIEDIVREFGIPGDTPQLIWQNILGPQTRNRTKLLQDVRFQVGNIYAEVVDWCLADSHESGNDIPFTFFEYVYRKLQGLQHRM